jgi:hypothetical protein
MKGNMENLRIYIRREIWGLGGFSVYISRLLYDGKLAIAEPLAMRVISIENEGVSYPASMHFSKEDAQRFIDELWNAGLRPSEGTGSAGSLAATQRHLDDMRALVFKGKIEPQTNRP